MQLTLGELIDQLNEIAGSSRETEGQKPIEVFFDFCRMRPDSLHSYRGYYDQLAIGWTASGHGWTLLSAIKYLKEAVGEVFIGYKGGNFKMSKSTPMWVDNPRNAWGTVVCGVKDVGWAVIIETAYEEN